MKALHNIFNFSMKMLPYIISSRVRFARNLRNHRFPHVASSNERKAVLEHIRQAVRMIKPFRTADILSLDHLNPLERSVLREKNLITYLLTDLKTQRAVILPEIADASILVNEEDHLRIQTVRPGLALRNAWEKARQLDNFLKEKLDFAYSYQYGYLTTCPKNAGLGLRASVMMFVPGLIMLKRITPLIKRCVLDGYTIRGAYGEGSQSHGYLLQISNQRPAESNVISILQGLERVCEDIIQQEKQARFYLLFSTRNTLLARIARAEKQVLTMKQVSLKAGIRLLALYRLGVSLGIPHIYRRTQPCIRERNSTLKRIDQLFLHIQPAHVLNYCVRYSQSIHPGEHLLTDVHEDTFRAKLILSTLMDIEHQE